MDCLKTVKSHLLLVPSILLLTFTSAWAQDWQWVRDDLLINPSGVQSFGSARIDVGDIDGDSWLDLVVLDSVGMRLYQNRGRNTSFDFVRRPDWEIDAMPNSLENEIPTLADLNGDGRADLILPNDQTNSFRYWRNTGNVSNDFWTQADSILQGILGSRFITLADLDNDHDLDAITQFESKLKLYWNTGASNRPQWQLDPEPLALGFYNDQPNNIRFADIDHDGLMDIFAGFEWAFTDAIVGVGINQSISDSLIFNFGLIPSPLRDTRDITIGVGDLDKDGLIDLVSGHESPFLFIWSSDFDTARTVFHQQGHLGFPFGFLESGITILNWEETNAQEIVLVDLEPFTDIWSGMIRFTKFSRDNWLWLRETIPVLSYEGTPLFAPTLDRFDWDADGKYDFALGANKGFPWSSQITETALVYFSNNEPQPSFFSDFPPDSLFQDPSLVDIDGDGMLDLFIQQAQRYGFYENIGTLSDPNWETRPQWSEGLANNEHYRAEISDLTKDGLQDIVFGEVDGTLSFFRNIGTILLPEWQHDDTVFDVSLDSFAIPTLADLDFDSDLDLIIGSRLGRFYAFRNDFATSVSDESADRVNPRKPHLFQNYPNPFNAGTTLEFAVPKSQAVSIKIYDVLGREVENLFKGNLASGFHSLKWTPQNLASGAYFIQIRMEEFVEIRKATQWRPRLAQTLVPRVQYVNGSCTIGSTRRRAEPCRLPRCIGSLDFHSSNSKPSSATKKPFDSTQALFSPSWSSSRLL
jgi:hypothetical protein